MLQYHVLSSSAAISTVRVGVRSAPAPFDYTLHALIFSIGSPAAGEVTFDFRRGGVSIFGAGARPMIPTGQRSVAVTGLAIAGGASDILSWDVIIVPTGGIGAPVTCTTVLDDGLNPTTSLTVSDIADVPLVLQARKIYVGSGDLEALEEDGAVRLRTASDVVIPDIPSHLPPSGSAGGDLGGEYPNPSVVSLKSRALGLPDVAGLIEDDFDDNTFNTSLWVRSSSTDAVEQNQHMELRSANFFQTANTFDFTGRWFAWQQQVDVWARLHFDDNNYLEFRVSTGSGSIRFLLHTPGGGDSDQGSSISYSGIAYYKFEQQGDGKIHWLTSPDGATWTDRASLTPPVSIASCFLRWFGLAGDGTFRYVDSVSSNVLSADAISQHDGEALVWVQTNNRFELKKVSGVALAGSSAPSGAPSGHIAGTSELFFDKVSHRLYCYNENTGAWDWKSFDNS